MPGAVWLRERPPRRGDRGLTRGAIATETVRLLDRAGPAGLSMRALADALGVHATTLYWHVAARDDLLDLALDAVFAEIPLPAAHADDWGDDVRHFMTALRHALLRHPWSGALAGSRPLLGPEALARSEFVYAALSGAGFSGNALAASAAAISNLVIGSVAAESAWHHDAEATARVAMHQHLEQRAERYPTLAGLQLEGGRWDELFADAAETFLLGLRCRAGEITAPGPRAAPR
ncbi:TetR family transcriptional regulator [Pseudonocardia sp. MH-G8]|nr:TetR family transcriptional regulator [Pseudonocardia sp. MH-G8]